jgi:hypothetical protein
VALSKKIKIIVGGAIAAGAALLLYSALKRKYAFVEEQSIDLMLLPAPALKEAVDDRSTFHEKMEKARWLLNNGEEKHSTDLAAFLAFVALEEFLRSLISRLGVNLKTRLSGIVDACKRLRSVNGEPVISREDYDQLNTLTANIRNPLVHGEVYKKDEVPAAVEFIGSFIQRYESAAA